jgi:hypothetical protein
VYLKQKYPYILLLACSLSCKDTKKTVPANPGYPVPEKIMVYKENVYDLSGYENGGEGKPFNLFDENAYVDPRTENKYEANYTPLTDPQPRVHPDIYFPLNRGSRIVTDLRIPYRLSEIYIYDRSHSSDSVWIYTGNMTAWKLKAAFTTKGDPGMWGWRKFTIEDSTQYVMIRFCSYQTSITEMVLYGDPLATIPLVAARQAKDPPFTKKMIKEFLGVNDWNGIEAKWAEPFYYTRIYAYTVNFDTDTIHSYPDIQYNMLFFGYWGMSMQDYFFPMEETEKQYGHKAWYAMSGLSFRMSKGDYRARGRPVTIPGMDPEDPGSYARNANMMWTLAAFFGNKKVDTNSMSLSFSPKRSGRGTFSVYENGNEYDATWIGNKYCNPMEYFAQSSADYDGAENTLGPKCGVKNADSSSLLMTAGLIDLDTNRIRIYKFLCNTLRKDKYFLWSGGVQYHHYCNIKNHGVTPEEDSLRWKLAKVKKATDNIQPGIPCILGENGYDKFQGSIQATPKIPGLSNAVSQGIFILRCMNATAFSGFDAYLLYWLRDTDPEDNPGIFLTSGLVRQMPDGTIRPYASWFYVSAFENRLANYSPDKIISEKGDVWVYKYRNKISPDSVAYFVYSPTHDGTRIDDYALNLGKAAGGDAAEISFSGDNAEGIQVNKKILNGSVNLIVEESPKLIILKEK